MNMCWKILLHVLFKGALSFSMGVKRAGRESDYLSPSNAEVKNVWSCTYAPPYVFVSWHLVRYGIRLHGVTVKQRSNFSFTFTSPRVW
jgi:hypothetical protein